MDTRAHLYRTIWRWHFYAGLFVVPMVLVLALSGSLYLFKPQIERWEERAFRSLPVAETVSPDAQGEAALSAFPGARLHSYRLPEREGDAALVHIALPGGKGMRDVFVSPQGKVLGSLDPDKRIIAIDRAVHGQLLLGKRGSWIVELAASWGIVMILTGLYLWWPRGRGAAGVIYPRLTRGPQAFWRDLHAVTGFWVSGLALVLLVTGLPWASVWGSAFKAVRAEMGWVKGKQDWTIGGRAADADDHAGHDHAAMMAGAGSMHAMPGMAHDHAGGPTPVSLTEIVAEARSRHMAWPVIVMPPGAPGAFGAKPSSAWIVKADTQNRLLGETYTFDARTGAQRSHETFADKHPIDRVVGYGISWHEGALFGWVNQLIGVMTALMLVTLAVSGFVLWWRRKPGGVLGAPPLPAVPARKRGMAAIALVLAAFLPLLALSMAAMLVIERLVLVRIAPAARWLGLARTF